jgi:transketolase
VSDANDLDLLSKAFENFKATRDRPTLIVVDTHIGYGAPDKQDTAAAHGEPLGEDEVRAAKRFYGWPEDAHFLVPKQVYEHFREGIGVRGAEARADWFGALQAYGQMQPARADEVTRMQHRQLPDGWDRGLPVFPSDPKGLASRDASGQVLNVLAQNIPWLLGGAADLDPSTKTRLTFDGAGDFEAGAYGPQLPLRHPRTRDVRDRQRHGAGKGPPVRLRLPDLHRLRARGDPALGADGTPGHLHLDP